MKTKRKPILIAALVLVLIGVSILPATADYYDDVYISDYISTGSIEFAVGCLYSDQSTYVSGGTDVVPVRDAGTNLTYYPSYSYVRATMDYDDGTYLSHFDVGITNTSATTNVYPNKTYAGGYTDHSAELTCTTDSSLTLSGSAGIVIY